MQNIRKVALTQEKMNLPGPRTRKRSNPKGELGKRKPSKSFKGDSLTKPIKKSKQKKTNEKKGPWTEVEDTLLTSLVDHLGSHRWSEIAKKIKGREGKQCRERWHNHLNPDIKKGAWTVREQWVLFLVRKI